MPTAAPSPATLPTPTSPSVEHELSLHAVQDRAVIDPELGSDQPCEPAIDG